MCINCTNHLFFWMGGRLKLPTSPSGRLLVISISPIETYLLGSREENQMRDTVWVVLCIELFSRLESWEHHHAHKVYAIYILLVCFLPSYSSGMGSPLRAVMWARNCWELFRTGRLASQHFEGKCQFDPFLHVFLFSQPVLSVNFQLSMLLLVFLRWIRWIFKFWDCISCGHRRSPRFLYEPNLPNRFFGFSLVAPCGSWLIAQSLSAYGNLRNWPLPPMHPNRAIGKIHFENREKKH